MCSAAIRARGADDLPPMFVPPFKSLGLVDECRGDIAKRRKGVPEFHLAQPAAECVSSQNNGGRNSVRSEGALGHRARPAVYRRDLRSLKKCPSEKI